MNPNSTLNDQASETLKIVVIGGTGLIGAKIVHRLRSLGHEVLAASPSTGVNTLTGAGLAEALAGAQIVIDVSNAPTFEDQAVMAFFETAGRNIAAAEKAAGVAHHIALSVVGTDRLQASGYFRAKLVQENIIRASGIPFTIIRATQFFEFVGAIAQFSAQGDVVHPAAGFFEPIAAEDVADVVTEAALAAPANHLIEIAGPERLSLTQAVGQLLASQKDPRPVTEDATATYFGVNVTQGELTAGAKARRGLTRLAEWLQ